MDEVAAEMQDSAETRRLLGMFTRDYSARGTWMDSTGKKTQGGWYRSRHKASHETMRQQAERLEDAALKEGRYEFFRDGWTNYPSQEEEAEDGPIERVASMATQILPSLDIDHITKEMVDAEQRYVSERIKKNEERVRELQDEEQDKLFGLGTMYTGNKVKRPAEPYEYANYQQDQRMTSFNARLEHMDVVIGAQQKQQRQRAVGFLNNRANADEKNTLFTMDENANPENLPKLSRQIESALHVAARDLDTTKDPFVKNVARYGILGDSDPKNEDYVAPVDPKWGAIKEYINYARQAELHDPQLWSPSQLKTLWIDMVTPAESRSREEKSQYMQFSSYEEFFNTARDLVSKNSSDEAITAELLKRLKAVYPQFTETMLNTVMFKILGSLFDTGKIPSRLERRRRNYTMDSNELVIQSITDNVTDGGTKFSFFKFSELAGQPMPKLGAVYDSIEAMSKNRVKERQWYAVAENMKNNDPRIASNSLMALYETLRPIHDPREHGASEAGKRKIYDAEIINGVSTGVGKRKSSIATVKVKPGNGLFTINGRDYLQYLTSPIHKIKLSIPLSLVDIISQFDINVNVKGGGTTGQLDAIQLGLVRAVSKFVPEFGFVFARHGFMRRDAREVERKKPGRKKARKRFQWVKR